MLAASQRRELGGVVFLCLRPGVWLQLFQRFRFCCTTAKAGGVGGASLGVGGAVTFAVVGQKPRET